MQPLEGPSDRMNQYAISSIMALCHVKMICMLQHKTKWFRREDLYGAYYRRSEIYTREEQKISVENIDVVSNN